MTKWTFVLPSVLAMLACRSEIAPGDIHTQAVTASACDDGIFCNGTERLVNQRCETGPLPCDDGQACTADTCDESAGLCQHIPGPGCAVCAAKNCNPSCRGALCGDDGCGGSCGTCPTGNTCQAGACVQVSQPGTCQSPLPLLAPDTPFLGEHTIAGDTTGGVNETVPACNNSSTAPEIVYAFTVPAGSGSVGIDARSSGFDTVLHLRRADCLASSATVACSDDASPPGGYGSRVATMLAEATTYYLFVDGYDSRSFGPFTLTAKFVAGCVPQCDGKLCGDDGCGGGCGACGAGELCNAAGRCVASPCKPDCRGRKCGGDGCGGSCGTCPAGTACATEIGACKAAPACDHLAPVCKTACSSNQFCGTDCECHDIRAALPDLVVDAGRLSSEVLFDSVNIGASSCAVVEGCVNGTGLRRLMRFSVEVVNQGQGALQPPPPKTRPDLFEFSPCHGHYHFSGFAQYRLLDRTGRVVLAGHKQAYCMEDSRRALSSPAVSCTAAYTCESQGIQSGWADLYGNALDCQWLDITGMKKGRYQLQVTVNPGRTFEEQSFSNNTTTVPVLIE